jgi:hypothetical protein
VDSFLKGVKSGAFNGLLMAAIFIPLGVLVGTFASPIAGGALVADAALMLAKTALVMMLATSIFSGISSYRRDANEEQTSVTTSITRKRGSDDLTPALTTQIALADNQPQAEQSNSWQKYVVGGKDKASSFVEAVQNSQSNPGIKLS